MNQQVIDKVAAFFEGNSTKTYRKGEIITFAGHEPDGISLLLSGIVEKYDITTEGNKVTVNIFKPHSFFPMSWAINKTPNAYFYTALTDVTLKQAGADETVAFLHDNPDVLFDLLGRVYKGADALLKRLVLAVSGVAANRILFELLVEAYRFTGMTGAEEVSISIRQSVLAARCGLARETVSRELHKLEAEKLVDRSNRLISFNVLALEKKLDLPLSKA